MTKIPTKALFIDHEATGGHPPRDTIYEIAIVDDAGNAVLDTLVDPERPLPSGAKYRGLTESDFQGKPTLRQLWPTLDAIMTGCHAIIWNAEQDRRFYPKRLGAAGLLSCAMKRFAPIYGDYSTFHNDYTFKSLKVAADYIEYQIDGPPHRALTDAMTCRAVWQWMENREEFNEATRLTRLGISPATAPDPARLARMRQ